MEEIKELKEKAKMLEDVRQKNKKVYKIWDIVVVVILAVLSDCNEWSEIEDFAHERKNYLKKYLKLTGGIPTAKTYERVIGLINSNELNKIFVDFCEKIQKPKAREFKEILSFDGKVEKGSARKQGLFYNEKKPLNVLNVYSDRLEMCIDQEMIEEKTNEIPTVKNIIERLELKGVICTWDALNTQKSNVKAVIDKKGDYVVPIKGNHENFYKELEEYFEEDRQKVIESGYEGSYSLTREKSHSAIITYEYYQTEKVKWYEDYKDWEKLRSIGMVKKTIEKANNKKVVEKRYYISSLFLDINNFSNAIRKHWNVENKLHWQIDFTFKCDDNQTINKKALFNLQIIKKFCLKILNEVKKVENRSMKRIRKSMSRSIEYECEKILKIMRNFDIRTISN